MSGHTPWHLRESRLRTLTGEQRAEELARHRRLLEQLRFQVWRMRVEERFVAAMAAAAEGRPVEWPDRRRPAAPPDIRGAAQ